MQEEMGGKKRLKFVKEDQPEVSVYTAVNEDTGFIFYIIRSSASIDIVPDWNSVLTKYIKHDSEMIGKLESYRQRRFGTRKD